MSQLALYDLSAPKILGFFGPFRFLSNFHFVEVEYEGLKYRTTEHAYQAAKSSNKAERLAIQSVLQPREARQLGQQVKLSSSWHEDKYEIMLDLTIQKYSSGPLRQWLLDTGESYLEETNTWGDIYWGVCNGVGENNLGHILMEVRRGLRELNLDCTCHGD